MSTKTSKIIRDIVFIIIWYVIFVGLALYATKQSNTPLYSTYTVDIHEPHSWTSSILIGKDGDQIYARSERDNFSIYDQSRNFICTGVPVDFAPGERFQPFECNFASQTGLVYLIEGSADIYTLIPTEITFEVVRFGFPALAVICWIIVAFSTILIFVSLVSP